MGIVLGCHWGVCGRFGTDIPELDEWDAEGINLFVPRAHHDLRFHDFWAIHVDHHVLLTRALAYVETTVNGAWDQRLETVVNAVLGGGIAAALFLIGFPHLSRPWRSIWFLLLAAVYAPPWATDNVLRGFHSQQYFLVGLALIVFARPTSWPGWLAAILALGSMASGFFAAALAGLLLAWRRRSLFPSVLIYAGVVVAAFAVQTSMPATQALKARSPDEFFSTLVQSLGWPGYGSHWELGSLLLYVPWLLLLWQVLRRGRERCDPWHDFVALLGAWSLCQCLAAAYARGWGGLPPPTRYIDNIVIGLLANALSAAALLDGAKHEPQRRPACLALASAWFVVVFTGLSGAWPGVVASLRDTGRSHVAMARNVRGYLTTGDRHYLEHGDIPYVGVEATQVRLNMPELRPLLPASIQGAAYRAPIGSRLARWLTHAGWAVAAAAAAGAVLLCL